MVLPPFLGGSRQDVMASSEGVRPGLHARSLQQLLGLLMSGTQLQLLDGNKGPAGQAAGSEEWRIRKKITRIKNGLTVTVAA